MSFDLLNVLSSRGCITLKEYFRIFDYFYQNIGDNSIDRKKLQYRILFYLESLGHCEFDNEENKVYICNTALAVLPGSGSIRAVLCGARDENIINKLYNFQEKYSNNIDIEFIDQVRDCLELPEVIKIKTFYEDIILKLSKYINAEIQVQVPTSWLILNASCDIKEYEFTLKKEPLINLNWTVKFFNIDDMYFQINKPKHCLAVLKEYINPFTNKKKYYIDIEDKSYKVDVDWGRYYLYYKLKKNILFYDEKKQALGVPCFIPLPKLLSKALTLCSGILPLRAEINYNKEKLNNISVYVYTGVENQVVQLLENKLGQKIIKYTFKNDEIGGINCARSN